jgi:hypothetical protein
MQLKKAIITLAMINFNLGMNDNQNIDNVNLIQRNPDDVEIYNIDNYSTHSNNTIILSNRNSSQNSEVYINLDNILFDYTKNEIKNLWNVFMSQGYHYSQFSNFLNGEYAMNYAKKSRENKKKFPKFCWRLLAFIITIVILSCIINYS